LKHVPSGPSIFRIRLRNNQALLFDPGQDHLTVAANSGQLNVGIITGNRQTASLQKFYRQRNLLHNEFGLQRSVLQGIDRINDPEGWRLQEAATDSAMNAYREYVKGYADTVPYPELAWFAAVNLNPVGDFYYIQQFVMNRKAAGEKSIFINHLEKAILDEGKGFLRFKANDFTSKDIKGDSVKLSAHEGRVTFVFIWASYCGMSRMETKRLATWRHSHPDVPIDILTISIDENEDSWRTAVREDSLDWIGQLRGDAGWGSREIRGWGVKSIPVTYVLDANGIFRSKNATASDLGRDYAKIVEMWGDQQH
jgi:hypothetical protein